jgi:hypothetical protein
MPEQLDARQMTLINLSTQARVKKKKIKNRKKKEGTI